LSESLKGIESARVEVEECAEVVRRISDKMDIDPERQGEIEERLSLLIGLEKKYGRDEHGLMELVTELQEQVVALSDAREHLKKLEEERDHARDTLEEAANALSRARLLAAERLTPQVEAEFKHLGLDRSRLRIRLEPLSVQNGFAGDVKGKERASFLFSSALEEEAYDLTKVASGGELSRIMLALKSILRESDPVDAMVFDEIDTGVGGSLAPVIGDRLFRLGKDRQIICITHLAAVASAARNHFVVNKDVEDRISIRVKRLGDDERVIEIARMLGGLPTSQEAIRHSQVLLSQYTQGGKS
jgi:DNA repair protein RecN (Recombination protein N)